MWVPLEKLKKIKDKWQGAVITGRMKQREFFYNFYSLSFLSQIPEFLTVGICRDKSALRDEGYAWVPETRDFTENSGKYSENPNF